MHAALNECAAGQSESGVPATNVYHFRGVLIESAGKSTTLKSALALFYL
jgi:hypothetical protein